MSVRAQWFAGAALQQGQDHDPFSDMTSSSTTPLSAESSKEDFDAAFARLFNWGSRLERMGVECPLRSGGECICSACPVSKANDPDAELYSLCRQGAELERVTMLARVASPQPVASGV